MLIKYSLGNARALDLWRREIGLSYETDTAEGNRAPISGQVLEVKPRAPMKYGRVPGVEKEVSKLVLGTMFEGATLRLPHAFALMDNWIEHGGNAFDTGHIYGTEPIFGQWLAARGFNRGKIFTQDGRLVASVAQEGLMRLRE